MDDLTLEQKVENAVNEWFNDTFQGHGPALSVEVYNRLVESKDKFQEKLRSIVTNG